MPRQCPEAILMPDTSPEFIYNTRSVGCRTLFPDARQQGSIYNILSARLAARYCRIPSTIVPPAVNFNAAAISLCRKDNVRKLIWCCPEIIFMPEIMHFPWVLPDARQLHFPWELPDARHYCSTRQASAISASYFNATVHFPFCTLLPDAHLACRRLAVVWFPHSGKLFIICNLFS